VDFKDFLFYFQPKFAGVFYKKKLAYEVVVGRYFISLLNYSLMYSNGLPQINDGLTISKE